MLKKIIVLGIMFTFISNAAAVDNYGGPEIGDYEREQFEKLLINVQEFNQRIREANAKISAARYKFFTSKTNSLEHKKAEDEFAKWLQDKDYVYFDTCVKTGAEDGLKRFAFFSGMSGGLDNGIRKTAIPSFSKWVTAVRSELGVYGNQIPAFTDADTIIRAMRKKESFYKLYKIERDKAEYSMWRATHPQKNEMEGNLPLFKQEIKSIFEASNDVFDHGSFGNPESQPLKKILLDPNYKQQILSCSYGPLPTEMGETSRTYAFWYKAAPDNLDELMSIDSANALLFMGNKGFVKCPQTDGDAQKEKRDAYKFANSPQYVSKRKELKSNADAKKAENMEKRKKAEETINRVFKDCAQLSKKYQSKHSGAQYSSRDIFVEASAVGAACRHNRENDAEQLTSVKAKHEDICNYVKGEINRVSGLRNYNPERLKKMGNSEAVVCDASFTDIDAIVLSGSTPSLTSKPSSTTTVEESPEGADAKSSSSATVTSDNNEPTTTETPVISQQVAQSALCKAMAVSIAEAEQKATSMRDKITLVMSKNSYRLKCGGN